MIARSTTAGRARIIVLLATGMCLSMLETTRGEAQTYSTIPTTVGPQETPVQQSRTQDQAKVSLTVRDSTVAYVIQALVKQTSFRVAFNAKNPRFAKRVSVKITSLNIMDALAQALKGTGLIATFADNQETIVVRDAVVRDTAVSGGGQTETGSISGRVLDSMTRKGVGGATITVVGRKNVTTTRDDGTFRINDVAVGAQTLSVKLLGYQSRVVSVTVESGKNIGISIVVFQTSTTLSEVVTTATGTQRKYEIGNAITSVNVDSIMRIAPITSLTDLLETRVPGLTVQRTSGAPGDPARLRLRGAAGINSNNDPIVVVDGVRMYSAQSDARNGNSAPKSQVAASTARNYAAPSPLDQIDPNSIETIDVFKGPSAAALYGSDAANGVIVITTRRGRAGPPRWNLALNQGIAYLPDKYPEGTWRWGTFAGLGGASFICLIDNFNCTQDSIVRYQALNDPYQTILGRGSSSGVTASVSGGPQTLQYSFTASMNSDNDYLKLSDAMLDNYVVVLGRNPPGWMRKPGRYGTWSGQGRIDASIRPDLTVAVQSSLYTSAQRRSSLGLEGIGSLMGKYLRPSALTLDEGFLDFYEQITSDQQNTMHTVQSNWRVASWLPLLLNAGQQTLDKTDKYFVPRGITGDPTDSVGRYGIGRGTTTTRSASLTTTVPTYRDRITTVFGLNYIRESSTDLRAFIDALPPGVSIPTTGLLGSQSAGGRTSFGWLIEPKLNLHSRLFVVPGFRLDNNGLAGGAAKLMGLPKMNVSWLVSDEPLFPQTGLISLLRLRAGYGAAGVQPGPIDRLRLYAVDTVAWVSGGYTGGAALSALGNTKLRPERGTEWEGGFEAAFWRNRVNVDATWYRKMRYDAIERIPLSPSLSVDARDPGIAANIGVIRNQGMDASISAQVIERAAMSWFVSVALWQNSNIVQRLNAGQEPITVSIKGPGELPSFSGDPAVTKIVPGYPLFGWWARPIVSYGDANGNGVIEQREIVIGDSAVYLGAQDPGRTMNVSTTLTFLNGRLSVNAAAAYTGQFSQFNAATGNPANSPFRLGANDPNASLGEQAVALARTPYGRIQTITVWRFQSFAVNYAVPPSVARLFRSTNMRVALQGSNLGLKTNYSGKDPNVNSYPTGNATVDLGASPQPRTWSLRVTLGN